MFLFLSWSGTARAAEMPRVFEEPADGVAHARAGGRLILFLLTGNVSKTPDAILAAVTGELAARGHEFAIVRCRPENADHRRLFAERFRQDSEKRPLAVIATATGEVVAGASGDDPEAYRLAIRAARVQAGLEKEAPAIAALREELAGADELVVRSIFGIKRSEVEPGKALLSGQREWTFANGTKERAALLEAKGATGIFVKPDGSRVEWSFSDFGPAELQFLRELLSKP